MTPDEAETRANVLHQSRYVTYREVLFSIDAGNRTIVAVSDDLRVSGYIIATMIKYLFRVDAVTRVREGRAYHYSNATNNQKEDA